MRRPYLLFAAVLFALLAGLATLPVLIELPARTATPMPGGEFNEVRAKARLAAILGDQRSHPADSFGDDAVRTRLIARIRALGLTPIVRDRFACSEIYKKRGVTCARVRNLLVALGPAAGKAVLLNAHYDSNPAGPGASDDGAGVATLLEIAAILKNERLERPVLLLFNEGEELGLVGARAFLADPLSKRVDSLINVEARGVTGPVTMFETSDPNGPAVRAFARSVDRPYANSLATDFYRLLPNYTDVNAFAERGWTTLNFAMIGNETRYHSAGDDLEALDSRSLKHMGDQALALARELAGASPGAGGAVIFADLAGRWLVVLPVWMGVGLLTVLVAGLAFVSLKRGETRRGLLVITGALIGSALIAWLCLFLVGLAR
ncbi:MAG TPA: M20/M25/M40 family metallo-hydrolase, partial [Sphingomicrobium sp.]|nr:M20/M25/M40 family metallo-hydrolase [Sphingomicrobium sp.]